VFSKGEKITVLQMFAQPVEEHVFFFFFANCELRTARLQLTFDIWRAVGMGVPTNS